MVPNSFCLTPIGFSLVQSVSPWPGAKWFCLQV